MLVTGKMEITKTIMNTMTPIIQEFKIKSGRGETPPGMGPAGGIWVLTRNKLQLLLMGRTDLRGGGGGGTTPE